MFYITKKNIRILLIVLITICCSKKLLSQDFKYYIYISGSGFPRIEPETPPCGINSTLTLLREEFDINMLESCSKINKNSNLVKQKLNTIPGNDTLIEANNRLIIRTHYFANYACMTEREYYAIGPSIFDWAVVDFNLINKNSYGKILNLTNKTNNEEVCNPPNGSEVFFTYGISPPRPDRLLIDGEERYYLVEGDTVDIKPFSFEISYDSEPYSFEVQYRTKGNEMFQNVSNPSSFVVPSFSELQGINGIKKIEFRIRSVRPNGNYLIKNSPYRNEEVEVRPKPLTFLGYTPFYCNENTTRLKFKVNNSFNSGLIVIECTKKDVTGQSTTYALDTIKSDNLNLPSDSIIYVNYSVGSDTSVSFTLSFDWKKNINNEWLLFVNYNIPLTLRRSDAPTLNAGSIGSDQVICYNVSPKELTNISYPTGGSPNIGYTYQWQKSISDTSWTDISGATGQSYSPPSLTQTTYYRRVVTSGTCGSANSNTITVKVHEQLTAGSIGNDQTICYNAQPATLTGTSPTGGTGNYTYQWQMSTDNTSWSNIPGTTGQSYSPPRLTDTTYFRRVTSDSCGSATSNSVRVIVRKPLTAGSIGNDQTICYNAQPETLTGTLPTGGTGNYTYQWQMSTDGTSWDSIKGATGSSYTPDSLKTTTRFRRKVKDDCGEVFSNTVIISVRDSLQGGSIVTTEDTICYGAAASIISNVKLPIGGVGNYTYQWQMSTDGTSWDSIKGATGSSYTPDSLKTTTRFRRKVKDDCGEVFSNTVIISVRDSLQGGSIVTTEDTICYGAAASIISNVKLPIGGVGNYTYQWQKSTNGTDWENIIGASEISYTPGNLTKSNRYRRKVSDACGEAYSNTLDITVREPLTAGKIKADKNSICAGEKVPTILNELSPSGGTGKYSYQWQKSTDGITWVDISGNTMNVYTPSELGNSTYFQRKVTSGECGSEYSNSIHLSVLPLPKTFDVVGEGSYCTTNGLPEVALSGSEDGVSYQLMLDSVATGVTLTGTGSFLSFGTVNSSGVYSIKATDANGCSSEMSNRVNVEIVEPALVVEDPQDVLVLKGNDAAFTVKAQNAKEYRWMIRQKGSSAWEYINEKYFEGVFKGWESQTLKLSKTPISLDSSWYRCEVVSTPCAVVFSDSAMLAVNNPAVSFKVENVACKGDSSGTINVIINKGVPPYEVEFSNKPLIYKSKQIYMLYKTVDSISFNKLPAGEYYITISDKTGFSQYETFTIKEPSTKIKLKVVSFKDLSCHGANDGQIVLSTAGGWSNYLYYEGGKQVDSILNNLNGGEHYIKVVDSLGCTDSIKQNLYEPDKIQVSVDVNSPSCSYSNDGIISVSAVGGEGSFKYYRVDESALQELSNGLVSNVKSGSYLLRVEDITKCSVDTMVRVKAPDSLTINIDSIVYPTFSYSANGAIMLSATGGTEPYSFSIEGLTSTSGVFEGLSVGSYTVAVTDSHGCEASTDEVVLTTASTLKASSRLNSYNGYNIRCYGGTDTLRLTPSGGKPPYEVKITSSQYTKVFESVNANTTVLTSELVAGQYEIQVQDANGDSWVSSVLVTQPEPLKVEVDQISIPKCFGYSDGSVAISAHGGVEPYEYRWSNGFEGSYLNKFAAGEYVVSVTDRNGCKASQTVTINSPDPIDPDLPATAIICSNQTLEVDAGYPGASYSWLSDNGFRSNQKVVHLSEAGTYYLTVTDSKNCMGYDTLKLIKRNIEIEADFLLAEKATLADTIVAIDISWPLPDSIEWNYPDEFWLKRSEPWAVYLVPFEQGTYKLGITTYLMGCSESAEKTITILPANRTEEDRNAKLKSVIKEFYAYPNPSSGHFFVSATLSEDRDVIVEVYTMYGRKIISKQLKGMSRYLFDVTINQLPGVYMIRLYAGSDNQTIRVIVQ
jgi:hypothetical protein